MRTDYGNERALPLRRPVKEIHFGEEIMCERRDSESWRILAELASRESDSVKLMELAEQLTRAIDQQLQTREEPSSMLPPGIVARVLVKNT